ncbi:MAG: beta-propeller domain-containing protein [Pseudomonadota bacterium]|nr:beta-propeller domain-containing protein [Pseudomonadota bacterium]
MSGTPGTILNSSAGSSSESFSRTNIQEEGVDEPDVVKTDGEYLYIASNDRVNIVDAVPAINMHKVAQIVVPGSVNKIFIHGTQLTIIYSDYIYPPASALEKNAAESFSSSFYSTYRTRTGILVSDISNPAAPVTQRHEIYDGWLSAARSVDNTLHLVLEFMPPVVTAGIDPMTLLPKRYRVGSDASVTDLGTAVDVSKILHPEKPRWLNFVMIVSMDITQPNSPPGVVAYLGDSYAIYASPQALYIVQSDYRSFNNGEVTIQPVTSSTQIHKFTLHAGSVQAAASGTVAC